MKKEVMILTGAGQIGMAIARRMGYGKKIVVGDLNPESTEAVCRILNEAGFDAVPVEMNLSSRESILNLHGNMVKFQCSSIRRAYHRVRLPSKRF